MNKRSILKTSQTSNSSSRNAKSAAAQQTNQAPTCKDGVCQVTWKPQRPAA
jgi:hypothetical protein